MFFIYTPVELRKHPINQAFNHSFMPPCTHASIHSRTHAYDLLARHKEKRLHLKRMV